MSKNKRAETRGDSSTRETLRWIVEIDTIMLDALLEEVHKGNRSDDTFTSLAYVTVVRTLQHVISPFLKKQHIKNRMKTLNDHFNECYDLFHKWSRVGWNPETQMFEAEPEVWNEILQDKPEAQKWRRTPISNYDKLLELFGRDRATDACAETSKNKAWRFEREGIDLNDGFDVMSESDFQLGNEGPTFTGGMDAYTLEYPPSNPSEETGHSNQSCGTSSSRGSKQKASMIDVIETVYDKMNMGITNFTNVMREVAERQIRIVKRGLNVLQNSRPRHYIEEEVWTEMDNIRLLPELRLKCNHFLCENEMVKRQFLGVTREMCMNMLYQLMTDARLL